MALLNHFQKPFVDKVEVFEFHKCILCNTEYLIEDSFDILYTYILTGETLHSFLSKINNIESILSGNSDKYMCRKCVKLVNVLVKAEMQYKKAKADFDAVISKNPLCSLPIKKIKTENMEVETQCSIPSQSLNGVNNNKSNLVKIKNGPGDCEESVLVREERHLKKINIYTHNVIPSHCQQESQDDNNMMISGSDLDSEDDEDPATLPKGIPRTTYILMDTPKDPERPPSTLDALEPEPAWLSNPFYDFKWKSHPKTPISKESRRERFKVPHTGPNISYTESVDIFKYIWDEEIMTAIATETNRYAEQLVKKMDRDSLRPLSRICDWKETTPEELYVFFGIILAMGVVIKSKLSDYWSTSNDVVAKSGFNSYMSLRRFQLLYTCLHFNNAQMPRNVKSSEAKLMKIKPILDHLNKKFQDMYVMDRNIGLDETLLQRGWQYIPNRKVTAKIKSYELCEVQTGYLWRFIIDSNSPEAMTSVQDPLGESTPASVLKLLKGLEHKGYTVWMDDSYNSPILARKLKSLGFDCVGPVRTNRQFVPIEIMNLDKSQIEPGKVASVTSGDVDLMVWRDQNIVSALSTFHGNFVSSDSDGIKPILIRDYITVMEGLDTKDRILSLYAIDRNRYHAWYKKLFLRLLHVSVFNAYVIHWHQNERLVSHREFRMGLVKLLLKSSRPILDIESAYDLRHHYLKEYEFLTGSRARLKRVCVVCRGLATTFCVGCNKTTCLVCFRQLHM